jgi:hypothetical protein
LCPVKPTANRPVRHLGDALGFNGVAPGTASLILARLADIMKAKIESTMAGIALATGLK